MTSFPEISTVRPRPSAQAKNIYELFAGKVFRVPDYQRMFAWSKKNWDDFWNDIKEGLLTETEHYWGTITLQATDDMKYCRDRDTWFKVYEVVDGQQRITTIYLFLLALSNVGSRPAIKENYIKCSDIYRLELSSLNNKYLKSLIDGEKLEPTTKTNRLLKDALEYLEGQVKTYGIFDKLSEYIQRITFSLEFVVQNQTLAVKTFETLNDRGKPLTLLDKTKSLLMFYSYRYIKESAISDTINRAFGDILTNYDIIKEVGERTQIDYIRGRGFSENELLRFFYHYFASYANSKFSLQHAYFYDIAAESVFDGFIKPSCIILKDDRTRLQGFILEFLENFEKFVQAFKRIIDRVEHDCRIKKLFSFLGLSTRVYPLIISLESEGFLDDIMLHMIESLDLRVYKVRGTEPRADLYNFVVSQVKNTHDPTQINNNIRWFIVRFMPDSEFQAYLSRWISNNPAVKYILWEFEKQKNPVFNDCDFDFYEKLQVEHVFPVTLSFSLPAYGFDGDNEYWENIYKLGNLILLEKNINIRVSNKAIMEKSRDYLDSNIPSTKELGFKISNYGLFKNDVSNKTSEITNFCLSKWNY